MREQLLEETDDVNEIKLYYDAVGGAINRKIYGLGSTAPIFYKHEGQHFAFKTSSVVHIAALEHQVQELQQQMEVQKQQMQQQMEAQTQQMQQQKEEQEQQIQKQ